MQLKLNVYTDDTLTEIERTIEADRLKIPYRVAMYIGQSLDNIRLDNDNDLFQFVIGSLDKLDKIIKATFGVTETELEYIDAAELGMVATELYHWGVSKMDELKGNNPKNGVAAAPN